MIRTPFASLFEDDAEWRGISRGHLWWKQTPSGRGPDEAREVLALQIEKRSGRSPSIRPEFTPIGDDRVIGSTVWLDESGNRIERYQVLTIRGGKIVDLQGCETRRQAERFSSRASGT